MRAGDWDMEFVTTPRQALQAASLQPFDVVVSDMSMPEMNGIDLVLALRQLSANTVYIMLTGTADLRGAIDAINKADVFRFFTKPCPADALMAGIEAALASLPPKALSDPLDAPPPLSASTSAEALDRLSMAVLVVDRGAHVRFMNKRGGILCAAADGLSLGAKGLCGASRSQETTKLHQLIASAIDSGQGGVLSLSRPSGKRPLSVAALPLGSQDHGDEPATNVALYVTDPEDFSLPGPQDISQLLDLSPSEARIAHSLSLGHSLDEAAALSGVTTSTARTYLKQVFQKTGTSRQAELVKLILCQPAVR